MKDYLPLIEQVRERKSRFGDTFQSPATPEQIKSLQMESLENLKYEVPEPYIKFLQSMNGFNWNGFTIYSSEPVPYAGDDSGDRTLGFLQNNLYLWDNEPARQFIFFGETGHSFYAFDKKTGLFASLDNPSLDIYATHESFSDMVCSMLETALQ